MPGRILVSFFLAAAFLSAAPAQSAKRLGSATYLSYNPKTGNPDLPQPLFYELPDSTKFGPGPYPVFFWVPGTLELYLDPLSLLMVDQMAQRGFLAVSVQYSDSSLLAQTCPDYTPRAQSIFDSTRSTSAVATICALSQAACANGVVASGISQGGILAVLAANYAPRVQAVYALSAGAYNGAGIGELACMEKPNTAIPANRLTIINGAQDPAFGSQSSVESATGITCPAGSTQCWSDDGSGAGWYLVQPGETQSGTAGHCYIDIRGCNDHFDPNWLPPSVSDWSLAPNLDWLATLGTQRVFASSGQ